VNRPDNISHGRGRPGGFRGPVAITPEAVQPVIVQAAPIASSTLATAPLCPSLPSSECAYKLVQGDWSQLPACVLTTAGRAVLIGAGMALLGERQNLVRNAIGGALGIEAFVLAFAYWKTKNQA
jgi:hypothetical protein